MGVHKSYKRHFQLKECNRIRLEKQQRNNSIKEINRCLAACQQANLNNLFSTIEQLSDDQLFISKTKK